MTLPSKPALKNTKMGDLARDRAVIMLSMYIYHVASYTVAYGLHDTLVLA